MPVDNEALLAIWKKWKPWDDRKLKQPADQSTEWMREFIDRWKLAQQIPAQYSGRSRSARRRLHRSMAESRTRAEAWLRDLVHASWHWRPPYQSAASPDFFSSLLAAARELDVRIQLEGEGQPPVHAGIMLPRAEVYASRQ